MRRTLPPGSFIFLTVRDVWYVMFSVMRLTLVEPDPGRDVGRGNVDAVPGTPLALELPEPSSVRCEVTITLRAGSKISSLCSPPEKSQSTLTPDRNFSDPSSGPRVPAILDCRS